MALWIEGGGVRKRRIRMRRVLFTNLSSYFASRQTWKKKYINIAPLVVVVGNFKILILPCRPVAYNRNFLLWCQQDVGLGVLRFANHLRVYLCNPNKRAGPRRRRRKSIPTLREKCLRERRRQKQSCKILHIKRRQRRRRRHRSHFLHIIASFAAAAA